MIIANGTIQFKTKKGTGMDPNTGYPLEPSVTWSEPIPCQFIPRAHNLLDRKGTEAREKKGYTILLEEEPLSDSFKLTGDNGKEIGEFSAISIETLQAVGQTKIIV